MIFDTNCLLLSNIMSMIIANNHHTVTNITVHETDHAPSHEARSNDRRLAQTNSAKDQSIANTTEGTNSVVSPSRDRPRLPKGYIKDTPKGMLTWAAAKKILTTAPYVWLATTGDDGTPHLIQSWAVWVDDVLYFEGSEKTRWAKNLSREPRLACGMQCADSD